MGESNKMNDNDVNKRSDGLGPYEKLLLEYEKELEKNPADPAVWLKKGLALGKLNRFEEAVLAFEKALQKSPDDPTVWFSKGVALG
ncbi:MAG: tetratricopeptide repeat protein, partial [Desulfotomaculaceae bacterium]|nr:tetratricopeptide repeat protein [Desulfotomaculaceae bacterium]